MKSTMEYLRTLNEAQRKAVEATQGPVLVLAGAGAGKTKTITHRIRHLIELGVPGRQILAVTFTNKAAKEMRDRVATLLTDVDAHSLPTVTTFHALGVSILRTNAQYFDMPRHFAIFDRSDSIRAVKEAIKAAGFSEKQYEPRAMLSGISKYKGRGVSYQEFAARSDSDYSLRLLEEVWAGYEKVLKREKAFDFDDLLLKTLTLLKTNEQVRTSYQTLWSYIHVDEYQDTNHVQYEIVRILAAKHRNICCVGDLDQNIYSWRGSTVENIMDFEKTFPGAIIILLEQNYRSTKTIVEASNHVIKKNKNRKEKHLFTENDTSEKCEMIMSYRYRALFQSVDLFFFRQNLKQTFKIICEAKVQLPLLKKSFETSTEFLGDYLAWVQHWPLQEKGSEEKKILRNQISSEKVYDPVGFFMHLNESKWEEKNVQMLVGMKTVCLDVETITQGLEIRRREKEQRLILRKGEMGIEKIEVPLPIIGNVVVERDR